MNEDRIERFLRKLETRVEVLEEAVSYLQGFNLVHPTISDSVRASASAEYMRESLRVSSHAPDAPPNHLPGWGERRP